MQVHILSNIMYAIDYVPLNDGTPDES